MAVTTELVEGLRVTCKGRWAWQDKEARVLDAAEAKKFILMWTREWTQHRGWPTSNASLSFNVEPCWISVYTPDDFASAVELAEQRA